VIDWRTNLCGAWRLARRIIDPSHAFAGARLAGRIEIKAVRDNGDDALLRHVEVGALRIGDQCFPATRTFFWRVEPEQLVLLFDDFRLLARFGLDALANGAATATHHCPPDEYRAKMVWCDAWRLTWRVRGPRKNWIIASHHHRI
jgi:hypothetical protein